MPEPVDKAGRAETSQGGDFEYDMAHEQPPPPPPGGGSGQRGDAPVHVSTATDDDSRDYSYDLAHDVPRSQGKPDRR